ncbi:zinc finger protein 674-like [Sitophilus oryzae]|uniref:Zinc finger protein 674-like n=1 Tax=Sitophilus oryzae TaxID=7048 RepID=A0A6J2XQ71_SITOR|nr:zinc finger protein 674-like [Sitophilus oryzae]
MRNHMRIHKEKRFKCETCGKAFKANEERLRHIRHVHEKIPYKTKMCDICGKVTTNYRMHVKVSHSSRTEKKEYVCEKCGTVFKSQYLLKKHLGQNSHNESKVFPKKQKKPLKRGFSCPVCNKVITTNESLQVHIRIHTGEKPFECLECGKCFISKGYLRAHGVVHTKEKPYVCKICSKGFTQRGTLKAHLVKRHPHDIL